MLDFTSAHYLGLRHASHELRPFGALTTGAPAALGEPAEAATIAAELARLVGVERALLARSTLHAFWDLFVAFNDKPRRVLVDAGSYPIGRWGAERAVLRGARFIGFRHHSPAALSDLLRDPLPGPGRDYILVDGFCAGCGRSAPLVDYLALAREAGARVVLDDTQALGVLGERPDRRLPYGYGGGGSLRASAADSTDVLTIASLAKGFAAPLAVVGGSASDIAQFEAASETRMHTSPPTLADLRAAEAGLYHNRDRGELLRGRLWALVARFRRDFGALGVQLAPTIFPIQGIRRGPRLDLPRLHQRLQARGVRTVLRRSVCANVPEISFLLTAAHSLQDIHEAARAVAAILAEPASVGWSNSLEGAP